MLKATRALFIREGDTGSAEHWRNELGITQDEFYELSDINIFRKQRSTNGTLFYTANLVGAIFLSDITVYSFPKLSCGTITDTTLNLSELILCLKVIHAYNVKESRKQSPLMGPGESVSEHKMDRLVDSYQSLISWTHRYGFHNEETYSSRSSAGSINWPLTIRSQLALHGSTFLVYDKPLFRKRMHIPGKLQFLQARVIQSLKDNHEILLEVFPGVHDSICKESDRIVRSHHSLIQNADSDINFLREFLASSNKDHERELAKILLQIFLETKQIAKSSERVIGSTSFYVIWEAVCEKIFDKFLFSQPFREISTSLKQHVQTSSKDWLRPDHLLYLARTGSFLILDSKWHDPTHAFASDDIVKQFMYQLIVHEERSVSGNAFLVPSSSERVTYVGSIYAEKESSRDRRIPEIKVIGLPWKKALWSYLNNESSDLAEKTIEFLSAN